MKRILFLLLMLSYSYAQFGEIERNKAFMLNIDFGHNMPLLYIKGGAKYRFFPLFQQTKDFILKDLKNLRVYFGKYNNTSTIAFNAGHHHNRRWEFTYGIRYEFDHNCFTNRCIDCSYAKAGSIYSDLIAIGNYHFFDVHFQFRMFIKNWEKSAISVSIGSEIYKYFLGGIEHRLALKKSSYEAEGIEMRHNAKLPSGRFHERFYRGPYLINEILYHRFLSSEWVINLGLFISPPIEDFFYDPYYYYSPLRPVTMFTISLTKLFIKYDF